MKITKKKLDEIRRCYCAASIHMKHENHIIYASEDPDVMCEMFSGKSFEHKETIWKKAGGCMSIIPIPDREGEFLAVQEFYLKVSPSPVSYTHLDQIDVSYFFPCITNIKHHLG